MRRASPCWLLLLLLVGCDAKLAPPARVLSPDPNPMGPEDPLHSPQPRRDRPRAICVTPDGGTAFVPLAGTEDAPGDALAVVALDAPRLVRRVQLGRSPWACAVDPTGSYVVVTLRYTDQAVVLDVATQQERARVQVPFYTENLLFSADGRLLYFTNRWKDSILAWRLAPGPDFTLLGTTYAGRPEEDPLGTPVAENPGPLALSSDGARLFVGSATAVTLSVLDARTLEELDQDGDPATTTVGAPAGISRLPNHSPIGGLAVHGPHLLLSDTGPGTGSRAAEGIDLDDDGRAGDGTPNVVFQDLQNELAVYDAATLRPLDRVTSDSLCCHDFRDVDPASPARGLLLPDPDTWGPELPALLPPRDRWQVAGALPEAIAVDGDELWVAYAASSELQRFTIDAAGRLEGRETRATGLNPKAVVVAGPWIVTVDRLAETLSLHPRAGGEVVTLVVGDLSAGPFPATDAELGEAVNELTSALTIDGDQSCVHCHRENGAIARPIVMPLQLDRLHGARNVPAQRGLYDTRPWFFESAMNEENFFPVLNEFARRENFCCEQLDPLVWGRYPTASACLADEALPGCGHVLRCEEDPPPECAARPYARSGHLLRTDFIRARARALFGRDTTFGDAIGTPLPDGTLRPRPLDFDGITRVLGLFMLRTPRLLPNPNRALELPTARRGRALFEDPSVGCAGCHPLPNTTTADRPTPFSPSGMPIRFPPVVSPSRAPDGADASRVTEGFLGSFPLTVQGPAGLNLGATPLRGLWDRPSTRLLHDGRARSLRELLSTPGHEALRPGEVGRNERDGVFDTHGGTSHLDRYQLEDLMNFLETL